MTTEELKAIAHELNFWKGFVQTKRFLDGWVKDIPTPELRSQVCLFIKQHLPAKGRVMDVGSGVVSIINGTVPKKNLLAIDPLGDLYQLIFDYAKHDIDPPTAIPCEELQYKDEFDIVHISNALDHTQNPCKAYERLLAAVKHGGHLIIQGFENEATFENWQGFHQWNLKLSNSCIEVTDKDGQSILLHSGCQECIYKEVINFENKAWFIWIAKKL